MKFRPGDGGGDYQAKLRNLVRFLEGGDNRQGHTAISRS